MKRNVYLYIFNSVSDWEYGYLMAELKSRRYFRKDADWLQVITVGPSLDMITTMGGLTVKPDISVEEMKLTEKDLLILPGGESWSEDIHELILQKVDEGFRANTLIAAICGAIHGLAKTSHLDFLHHTSNDLSYLQMVSPSYKGATLHQSCSVVRDNQLITASGMAPLDFAKETIKAMDVFHPEALEAWYNLHKTHESTYFFQLMTMVR